MKISLIIATKDRPDDLKKTLASVLKQTRLPDELIVVDDGNLDAFQVEKLLDHKIPMQYLKKDTPGLVVSRNKGVALANGDIISFIDDDVELAENYYEVVERTFLEDVSHEIGGVGGYVVYDKKGAARSVKNFLERLFFVRGREGGVRATGTNTMVEQKPLEVVAVDWLQGCNMNYRREIFKDHKFDEWFAGYGLGEDLEFSHRVETQTDFGLVITPKTELVHHESPAARTAARRLGFMTIQNRRYIFTKLKRQNLANRLKFKWMIFGTFVLEVFNKIANPMKNRGGKIFGMLDAVRGKEPKA